jgi:hypothetical protein
MALITCPECGAQISDKAAACPRCGAPVAAAGPSPMTAREWFHGKPQPPEREKDGPPVWVWIVVVVVLSLIALAVLSPPLPPESPESKAKRLDKATIDLCWQQQARKSLEPSTARFIAGACEQAEADFRRKYGRAP